MVGDELVDWFTRGHLGELAGEVPPGAWRRNDDAGLDERLTLVGFGAHGSQSGDRGAMLGDRDLLAGLDPFEVTGELVLEFSYANGGSASTVGCSFRHLAIVASLDPLCRERAKRQVAAGRDPVAVLEVAVLR